MAKPKKPQPKSTVKKPGDDAGAGRFGAAVAAAAVVIAAVVALVGVIYTANKTDKPAASAGSSSETHLSVVDSGNTATMVGAVGSGTANSVVASPNAQIGSPSYSAQASSSSVVVQGTNNSVHVNK